MPQGEAAEELLVLTEACLAGRGSSVAGIERQDGLGAQGIIQLQLPERTEISGSPPRDRNLADPLLGAGAEVEHRPRVEGVVEAEEEKIADTVIIFDLPVGAGGKPVFVNDRGGRLPEIQKLLVEGLIDPAEVVAQGLGVIKEQRVKTRDGLELGQPSVADIEGVVADHIVPEEGVRRPDNGEARLGGKDRVAVEGEIESLGDRVIDVEVQCSIGIDAAILKLAVVVVVRRSQVETEDDVEARAAEDQIDAAPDVGVKAFDRVIRRVGHVAVVALLHGEAVAEFYPAGIEPPAGIHFLGFGPGRAHRFESGLGLRLRDDLRLGRGGSRGRLLDAKGRFAQFGQSQVGGFGLAHGGGLDRTGGGRGLLGEGLARGRVANRIGHAELRGLHL